MALAYFLRILLISSLLTLCFSQGYGRKLVKDDKEESVVLLEDFEKYIQEGRLLIGVMDYPDPGPNPKNRPLLSPPPPSTRF
ncbi:hypothetical protein IFM89_031342 [Coptis chinensis]|uniref:Uncharacterized protein n=1 Tax=Coptis chinensis TaxID=261450 RepID=A0A835MB91_9MAGN|nr:hypothetical protein IFM89_031342 [Coptis chinensis]